MDIFNVRLIKSNWSKIFLAVFAMIFVFSCNKEEPVVIEDPVASFQFEVDTENFLKVVFTNFSQKASSYDWDFGDGNSSTEESPSHTYEAAGTYTVSLTAKNSEGKSSVKDESITITDPNAQLTLLAGQDSKTWYLLREGIALGIGPEANSNIWWSFGGVTPLGDRPCILDDSYTFSRDGSVDINTGGTVFIDAIANGGWKESEGCWDESDSDVWSHETTGEDVSDFANGGDYTYNLDNATGVLTIDGLGAYIGLSVKTNAGDNYLPVNNKTYTVLNFVDGDGVDSLNLALEGEGFSWNFYLVSYDNISDLPALPTAEPSAGFDFTKEELTVTFINQSNNSTSYSWDFGDGNSSMEENPVHTYGAAGDYDVTLIASDDNGNESMVTKMLSVSSAVFTTSVMSSEEGKVWRLAGEGSYKVGPGPQNGEWWPGIDADGVITRACQMDDEFIFKGPDSMIINVGDEVWAEAYMGGMDACMATSDLVAPFDAYSGGGFTFELMEADGDTPAKVKVIGTGAYIGFNKALNGAELPNDGTGTPAVEVVYDVVGYTNTTVKEEVVLAIDYVGDGCCYWTITIESLK